MTKREKIKNLVINHVCSDISLIDTVNKILEITKPRKLSEEKIKYTILLMEDGFGVNIFDALEKGNMSKRYFCELVAKNLIKEDIWED